MSTLHRTDNTGTAVLVRLLFNNTFLLNVASLLRLGDLDGPSGLSTRTLSPPRPK
eukprot:SAG22_NODE_848_length_6859_cov_5.488905_1_plen_54_part_10